MQALDRIIFRFAVLRTFVNKTLSNVQYRIRIHILRRASFRRYTARRIRCDRRRLHLYRHRRGESLVISTDMLVENVHFLRDASSPYELGCKSLLVNLSDVAAMGARPAASLLSLSLPRDATGAWAEEFMRGYHDISKRWGVALVGGDTTSSEGGIAVNVVALGRCPAGSVKRRSDAVPGDAICVTGRLGASAAGLRDILAGRADTDYARCHTDSDARASTRGGMARRPCRGSCDDGYIGRHSLRSASYNGVFGCRCRGAYGVHTDRCRRRDGRVRRRGLRVAADGRCRLLRQAARRL